MGEGGEEEEEKKKKKNENNNRADMVQFFGRFEVLVAKGRRLKPEKQDCVLCPTVVCISTIVDEAGMCDKSTNPLLRNLFSALHW